MGSRFREYITNYTAEQRQQALADLVEGLKRPETPLVLVALVALVFGIRYARRRWARAAWHELPPAPTQWFGELVALLAAHGIVAASGETALEFARRAETALRARPGCAGVAEVPLAWAEAYYQDRVGGIPPDAARLGKLEADLAALRRALET
jgi:hypothetical protein